MSKHSASCCVCVCACPSLLADDLSLSPHSNLDDSQALLTQHGCPPPHTQTDPHRDTLTHTHTHTQALTVMHTLLLRALSQPPQVDPILSYLLSPPILPQISPWVVAPHLPPVTDNHRLSISHRSFYYPFLSSSFLLSPHLSHSPCTTHDMQY